MFAVIVATKIDTMNKDETTSKTPNTRPIGLRGNPFLEPTIYDKVQRPPKRGKGGLACGPLKVLLVAPFKDPHQHATGHQRSKCANDGRATTVGSE